MRGFMYRILLTVINILFPPFAVGMLTGLNEDLLLNCCLLFLAVIPGHIHGFYVTCIYFHRRRKVKKGRYPGGPKPFIFSDNVLNGGASNAEVDRLWRKERGVQRHSSHRRDSDVYRSEMAQRSPTVGRGHSRQRSRDAGRLPSGGGGYEQRY